MKFTPLKIPDVVLIEPHVHGDERGFFMETWREDLFKEYGAGVNFVQENHSRSHRGVLRGLHYQTEHAQGKLLRITGGEVFDVAVDVRRSSPCFGQWVGVSLSAENKRQLWVPPGFAHGFLVKSESVDLVYKCTDYYYPEHERVLLWNDPALGIDWPVDPHVDLLMSERDEDGSLLSELERYR